MLSYIQIMPFTTETAAANGKKGADTTNSSRFCATTKLAELQLAMHSLAMDGELDPAKRTAAANTFVKLEERRRLNLMKANPAPVKSEPKRGKRSGGALRPAVVQVQPEPTVEPGTGPVPAE